MYTSDDVCSKVRELIDTSKLSIVANRFDDTPFYTVTTNSKKLVLSPTKLTLDGVEISLTRGDVCSLYDYAEFRYNKNIKDAKLKGQTDVILTLMSL